MTATEKLRRINNWLDYQNEYFNDRFKTIQDIEKTYDYCMHSYIVFLYKYTLETPFYSGQSRILYDAHELLLTGSST